MRAVTRAARWLSHDDGFWWFFAAVLVVQAVVVGPRNSLITMALYGLLRVCAWVVDEIPRVLRDLREWQP